MIDTHCHLLPGLDDGPPDLDSSLSLAREIVVQGVQTVVCTPHWSRQFPTVHADVLAAASLLREALVAEGMPLELHVSAEVSDVYAATRPIGEIVERAVLGKVVLVEMIERSLPVQIEAICARLASSRLQTMLAHPERCSAVQDDPSVAARLRATGATIQVIAPSLTGQLGSRARSTAWELLQLGVVDCVGSDAHDVTTRPCELAAAQELVADAYGRHLWTQLVAEAPARVLGISV